MTARIWAGTAAMALLAGGASAQAAGPLRFTEPKLVVFGDDGAPLYRADAAYVFAQAQNPGREARGVDAEHRLVRISAEGSDGLWVACDALVSPDSVCKPAPTTFATVDRGNTRGGPTLPVGIGASAVPDCPGDPRCP